MTPSLRMPRWFVLAREKGQRAKVPMRTPSIFATEIYDEVVGRERLNTRWSSKDRNSFVDYCLTKYWFD